LQIDMNWSKKSRSYLFKEADNTNNDLSRGNNPLELAIFSIDVELHLRAPDPLGVSDLANVINDMGSRNSRDRSQDRFLGKGEVQGTRASPR
jgi:hypothetical protein